MVRNSHYQAQDSDLLNLNTSISTSSDQIALAPGTLKGKWVREGRNHYNYQAQNIKSSFDFHSGNWALSTSDSLSFVVENYHHKKHDYNLVQMSNGVIAALNHNEKHYGSYEHEGVRIIEFSDIEGTYASTFANNLAVSEARYIANIDTAAGAIDITFYVAAHELTHHWWGSQVLPAHAEGALMLSESITEYNTLNIYRDHYGKQKAFNFLKLQRERYLKGRTRETVVEQPLAFVHPDQQYIAYGKGAMVFNALGHYIGDDRLRSILNVFLKKNRYNGAPYPTSLDLVDLIKQSVPDSLTAKVAELFETMTMHELSLITASKTAHNRLFTINTEITYNKKVVSREGYHVGLTNFDWVEIGLYNEADKLAETRHVRMEIGANTVSFKELTFEPYKIEVDPNLLLIDLDLEDNIIWF
jgi:ABC-2 type transport system permease protein